MARFSISLETSAHEADGPLEAAKELQEWLRDPETFLAYYVQNEETNELFSVDLQEDDDDAVLPLKEYTPVITSNI